MYTMNEIPDFPFPDRNYDDFLPLSECEMRWGLYLTGVGWDVLRPGDSCKYEGRPRIYRINWDRGRILHEYLLLYASQGNAFFKSESTPDLEIPAGSFALIHPGIWHTYKPDQKIGWTNTWLTLSGTLLHEYTERGIISPKEPIVQPVQPVLQQAADYVWDIVSRVRRNPLTNDPSYAGLLLSLLTTLYTVKTTIPESSVPANPAMIVQKAQNYIWNWGYREIDIEKMADRVGVTRRTLERYFAEELSRSIRDEIHRCRITRACNMLKQTKIKIALVAYMAGFSDVRQMNRAFMHFLKKTPGEIRENN